MFQAPPNDSGESRDDASCGAVKTVHPAGGFRKTAQAYFPNMPLISIMMVATSESEKDLQATIDSIKSQTYALCELCICKDGFKYRYKEV